MPPASLPLVGISLGDPNGIGPELLAKLFAGGAHLDACVPIAYGPVGALPPGLSAEPIGHFTQAHVGRLNFIDTSPGFGAPTPGQPSAAGGRAAFEALAAATADLKTGALAALLTLPIDKSSIYGADFPFPGHTEYLAHAFGQRENLMLMVLGGLRVAVATSHIPLREVADALTPALIEQKLALLRASLVADFGIAAPRIAVLGLNPHAGDRGLLGREEEEWLAPTLEGLRSRGWAVDGPLPADGFFALRTDRRYDAVLAMYHDQGLIPFKTITEGRGVNFTAGLPAVRTSPDHGTAYDIAGRGLADVASTREALLLALEVAATRAARSPK